MTEEEAISRLDALRSLDTEAQHVDADRLAIEALRAAGWGRFADAYAKLWADEGWWFA